MRKFAAAFFSFLVLACFALLTWAALALVIALPIWLLWNWLMPTLFKLPEISIFQALGLMLLFGLISGHTQSKEAVKGSNVK